MVWYELGMRVGTGVGVLRTAKFSKIHIKSNFDAVKKSSPFLKRSRAKESQKNMEKIRKTSESLEFFHFFFSGAQIIYLDWFN